MAQEWNATSSSSITGILFLNQVFRQVWSWSCHIHATSKPLALNHRASAPFRFRRFLQSRYIFQVCHQTMTSYSVLRLFNQFQNFRSNIICALWAEPAYGYSLAIPFVLVPSSSKSRAQSTSFSRVSESFTIIAALLSTRFMAFLVWWSSEA